jgi:hypothetical protein
VVAGSLVLLDDIQRRRIVGVDDPRERLAHNYRSWILDALDRIDEQARQFPREARLSGRRPEALGRGQRVA